MEKQLKSLGFDRKIENAPKKIKIKKKRELGKTNKDNNGGVPWQCKWCSRAGSSSYPRTRSCFLCRAHHSWAPQSPRALPLHGEALLVFPNSCSWLCLLHYAPLFFFRSLSAKTLIKPKPLQHQLIPENYNSNIGGISTEGVFVIYMFKEHMSFCIPQHFHSKPQTTTCRFFNDKDLHDYCRF